MKDKVFFDTNIIVYLFDKSEEKKHAQAKKIVIASLQNVTSHISNQVINEFIVVASQKIENPIPLNRIRKNLEFLRANLNIHAIDFETSLKAIDVKLEYQFSFWDSLIIASALESNCSILYSEDMQHGQVIEDNLKIINPFKLTSSVEG